MSYIHVHTIHTGSLGLVLVCGVFPFRQCMYERVHTFDAVKYGHCSPGNPTDAWTWPCGRWTRSGSNICFVRSGKIIDPTAFTSISLAVRFRHSSSSLCRRHGSELSLLFYFSFFPIYSVNTGIPLTNGEVGTVLAINARLEP